MLTLASPAALWALTGLLVPLAIHLWNRRPGQVVPVGALRWLEPGANRRMRQLHLTQWPLLLLRMLLLTLLVLAAAEPRWALPPLPVRAQVLLSPEALASPAFPVLRPTLDSLRRGGAELRMFSAGFPLLPDSLASLREAGDSRTSLNDGWYWQRAAQAAARFPQSKVQLYTTARQAYFRGSRPELPARMSWQTLPAAQDSGTWLHSAVWQPGDSLRLVVAQGNSSRTQLRAYSRKVPTGDELIQLPGLVPLRMQRQARGQAVLATAGTSTSVSAARTNVVIRQPRRGWVYFDARSRAEDIRYVRAALRVLAAIHPDFARPAIATTAPTPADSVQWLVWLSDKTLPGNLQTLAKQSVVVLTDASGAGLPVQASFSTGESARLHQLYQREKPTAKAGTTLWTDAEGQPVLSRRQMGGSTAYHLHTRLHPQWSSLPDDGQLPALLLRLLAPETGPDVPDFRLMDPTQIVATSGTPSTAAVVPQASRYLDLLPWVAVAAGILFGLERLLARRSVTPPTA